MQTKFISYTTPHRPTLLRKAVAIVAMVVLAGLVLMFSAVLLVLILIVGTIAWAYLWWKTRHVRKLMREQMRGFPPRDQVMRARASNDEVFEGEVIRVVAPDKDHD